MNLLDGVVIGQPTPLTLRQVLTLVIGAATPLIDANPSLEASPGDLALANAVVALAPNDVITLAQIQATARVVALGTDWLRANALDEIERDWPGVALLMSYIQPDQVQQYTISILSRT